MLLPEYIPMWVPRGVDDKIGYLCIKDLKEVDEEATSGSTNRFPSRGRGLKSKIDTLVLFFKKTFLGNFFVTSLKTHARFQTHARCDSVR